MADYYKLDKVNAIAENDKDFIVVLVNTLLEELPDDASRLTSAVNEKNRRETYQVAHKMKPTLDLFGLNAYNDLIELQNWGKEEIELNNVEEKLDIVINAIENAISEIKTDFNL